MVKNNFTYEDAYAMRILDFEKDMANKGRRPPLPTRRRQYENTAAAASAHRQEQMRVRLDIYKSVLDNIAEDEVVDVRNLAIRIGTTSMKLTNYMKPMAEEGYLNRMKMPNGRCAMSYVYSRTGKKLSDNWFRAGRGESVEIVAQLGSTSTNKTHRLFWRG